MLKLNKRSSRRWRKPGHNIIRKEKCNYLPDALELSIASVNPQCQALVLLSHLCFPLTDCWQIWWQSGGIGGSCRLPAWLMLTRMLLCQVLAPFLWYGDPFQVIRKHSGTCEQSCSLGHNQKVLYTNCFILDSHRKFHWSPCFSPIAI